MRDADIREDVHVFATREKISSHRQKWKNARRKITVIHFQFLLRAEKRY
jgi:hypothetical protein